MRKRISRTYLALFIALLAVMSLPKPASERMRGGAVATMAPMWHHLLAVKALVSGPSEDKIGNKGASAEEMERLRLENALLKEEIIQLKDVMQHEMSLFAKLAGLGEPVEQAKKSLKARHARELEQLLKVHLRVVPARVIFRSPASWNSSMWINVGEETNGNLPYQAVAKNSPVLIGTSVIGVVDYVGKRQSRVRLITDSGLAPSVRAQRGGIENLLLKEKIGALSLLLKKNSSGSGNAGQPDGLAFALEKELAGLSQGSETHMLAKGEVHGTSKPLWRSQRHLLKGTGFNYDFADGEGPARDLRSGELSGPDGEQPSQPIVQPGDLLVTTGMDGVFPPGLFVAEVTKVHPLKEGDYYYDLEAQPVVGNFDDLSLVFVIPPVGYDPDDQPPLFGW